MKDPALTVPPPFRSRLLALALGLASGSAQAALSFHVDLDENTGSTAADQAGSNDLTVGAGADWVGGKFGSALEFDGTSNSTASRANPTGLPAGNASRTLSLWVNYTTAPIDSIFGGYGNNISARLFAVGESYSGTDQLMAYFWDDSFDLELGPASNPLFDDVNSWQLHTLVYETGTNAVSYYVNGDLEGSVIGKELNTSPAEINIAEGSGTPTNRRQFEGIVDDFAIWNEVLTPVKAKVIYTAGDTASGGLGYDAGDVDLLFQAYDGQGTETVDGLMWTYVASGLTGTEGEVQGSGSNRTIVFDDASGAGLVSIPEPGTTTLALLSLLGLLRRRR